MKKQKKKWLVLLTVSIWIISLAGHSQTVCIPIEAVYRANEVKLERDYCMQEKHQINLINGSLMLENQTLLQVISEQDKALISARTLAESHKKNTEHMQAENKRLRENQRRSKITNRIIQGGLGGLIIYLLIK